MALGASRSMERCDGRLVGLIAAAGERGVAKPFCAWQKMGSRRASQRRERARERAPKRVPSHEAVVAVTAHTKGRTDGRARAG